MRETEPIAGLMSLYVACPYQDYVPAATRAGRWVAITYQEAVIIVSGYADATVATKYTSKRDGTEKSPMQDAIRYKIFEDTAPYPAEHALDERHKAGSSQRPGAPFVQGAARLACSSSSSATTDLWITAGFIRSPEIRAMEKLAKLTNYMNLRSAYEAMRKISVSQSKLYVCVEENNHVVPFLNNIGMRSQATSDKRLPRATRLYIECGLDVSFVEVLGAQNVLELGIHITISYIPSKAIDAFIETMTTPEAIVFVVKCQDKLILLAEKVAPSLRIPLGGPRPDESQQCQSSPPNPSAEASTHTSEPVAPECCTPSLLVRPGNDFVVVAC
ncbi:hypothetical protein DL770_010255 [Monosporascus sp. CRB-9-2]|nr:hypothetical protein DL770_010255 [Monosporascus sp. CRB-9-2]